MKIAATIMCSLILTVPAAAREWSDATGKHKVEADFLALASDGTLVLRKTDGKLAGVPLSRMSQADQDFARKLSGSKSTPASQETTGATNAGGNISVEFNSPVEADVQQAIRQALGKLVSAQITEVRDSAIEKVINGRVLEAELTVNKNFFSFLLQVSGREVLVLAQPSTTEDLPSLKSAIKPDFKITGQAEAKQLEAMLDAIYPHFIDEEHKVLRQNGTTWEFIRSKMFDELVGFVVTTNADGTIKNVAYSMEIKK